MLRGHSSRWSRGVPEQQHGPKNGHGPERLARCNSEPDRERNRNA